MKNDWSASVPLAASVASTRKNYVSFKLKSATTLFRAHALIASGTLALQSKKNLEFAQGKRLCSF
ncbi:MAG: hypothetical protein LH614_18285 [Pyrinomonadaceae bacterium]|nr:hypothetical protein [Pyrinomonadaceae bacterium]